ncbi:LCP family protein [Lactobacillus hominis]|uniref:Transcriptional regulator n=1 Tax=Lactobacillus hominis DSM 23910 = CRBIP 24.179 TaxID=1423758 RepID=I7IW34_9LACO|nr:LCP family protein [Lactobacillus hominis]KRM85138.1 transcriptional regulator [Lactobacillus hominis DSM 23910 = CRBIP 24.179]MCT3348298.1 LytR family transcriptional regulator [Lactobacillus hominis]CCI82498.1 Transcriptional regulator [Lactobacillus hominis DSM 23910 = CRBIP 24.179]
MDPKNPNTRENYRQTQDDTIKKLSHNRVFAAEKNKSNKKHLIGKIIGLVAVFMVGIGLAYFGRIYFAAMTTARQAYHGSGKTSAAIAQNKPVSILILGVDQGIEGRHDRGNSDTMILVTMNPQKKQATMTSIPRDLLVDVLGDQGKYYMFRVNSAYQVGGSKAAQKTVSHLVNAPIDYYMEVNMQALESMVDALGGVDVNVPFSFTYNTKFKKGKMHLNGKQALDYSRMRKEDPKGDYGRQMRQRQIITQIVHEGMSLNSVNNYRKILNVLAKYVKTNLTFNDMMTIAMNYRGCASNMQSGYIHGHDAWIGGASLQVASTKELQRVSDLIRSSLGLPKQKLKNEETRQNSLQKGLKWSDPTAFENYVIYSQHSDTIAWDGTN